MRQSPGSSQPEELARVLKEAPHAAQHLNGLPEATLDEHARGPPVEDRGHSLRVPDLLEEAERLARSRLCPVETTRVGVDDGYDGQRFRAIPGVRRCLGQTQLDKAACPKIV